MAVRNLDYVIKNHKNVYIRLNEYGKAVTCSEKEKTLFEYSKAKNILSCLPKTLKKLQFKVEAIDEISLTTKECNEENPSNVLVSENYVPTGSVSRWIEKFGICDEIIQEAKKRKGELLDLLSNSDRELSNELHKIELEKNKNACEGFFAYKRIKSILTKRREVKDELMIISNVIKMDFRCLNSDNVKKAVEGLANRKFTLRIVEGDESE